MDEKQDNGTIRISLGRLDANAPMHVIRQGDKVTVRVVNRREPEAKRWISQLLMDRLSIRPKAWRNGHVWESSEQDKKGVQVHRGE